MHVLITGGTGFIGSYLVNALLKRGDTVTIVTRSSRSSSKKGIQYVGWNDNLVDEAEKSDVVVNLAGSNLFDDRWNDKVKQEIISSRIDATRKMVDAINSAKSKPKVFVSGSAIGIYGSQGDQVLTEASPSADDFLATVCVKWEDEARKLNSPVVRLVIPRIGIVQQKDDGALKKMLLPFKLFGGGPIGSGDQYYPWIHMDDVVGSLLFAIDTERVNGPINITAPQPVTMSVFAKTLGEVMSRPSWFPVPEFVLHVAVGEAAASIVSSHRVIPQKLEEFGYTFKFPELKPALIDILKS
jgi:uncharacterized protein (TIGR01777 family)